MTAAQLLALNNIISDSEHDGKTYICLHKASGDAGIRPRWYVYDTEKGWQNVYEEDVPMVVRKEHDPYSDIEYGVTSDPGDEDGEEG